MENNKMGKAITSLRSYILDIICIIALAGAAIVNLWAGDIFVMNSDIFLSTMFRISGILIIIILVLLIGDDIL